MNSSIHRMVYRSNELLTKMLLVLLSVFCVATQITNADTKALCSFGQFMNITTNPSFCQNCPAERYMDEDNHVYTTCKICSVYYQDTDHVIEQDACTPEKNAVIKKCAEGFHVYDNECQRCDFSDCPKFLDCCSKVTVTPASTTSIPYEDTATTFPESPGPTSEHTKCGDIVIETAGCLGIEYEKRSCWEYKDSKTSILPCQKCSKITQTKVILCSAADVSSYDPPLHPAIIVVICIGGVILLGSVGFIYMKFFHKKNCGKRNTHVYILNKEAPIEKAKVFYDGQDVGINLLT